MDAVAAAWTQPAELLDIEVDQLARLGTLIAADWLAGGPVRATGRLSPWRTSTR